MPREKFAMLWAVCSLTACAHAPKVSPCVSDPPAGGLQCANADGSDAFRAYADSANYTCFSPDDLDAFVSWLKRQLDHVNPKDAPEVLRRILQ